MEISHPMISSVGIKLVVKKKTLKLIQVLNTVQLNGLIATIHSIVDFQEKIFYLKGLSIDQKIIQSRSAKLRG